ncbi:MAG TPA: hypothetical protein VN026_11970, partial [Bacteroidia bacterium]|nr:hypothetical protein [Bacteroidia bacterium]
MRAAYQNLADVYAKTDRYKEAYLNNVKFKKLTDSIFNIDNSKQLSDLKTKYEVEKKETELKAKADAQQEINNAEEGRQRVIIFIIAGLFVLVLVCGIFMFNRFKETRKQKNIIEEQKELVEEKQKEILSSIYYAKRIQDALLPADKYIERKLNRLIK